MTISCLFHLLQILHCDFKGTAQQEYSIAVSLQVWAS